MSEVSLSCQSEIKSHGLRSWTPGPRQLLALPLLEDHGLLFSPAFPRQNLTTNPLLSRCLGSMVAGAGACSPVFLSVVLSARSGAAAGHYQATAEYPGPQGWPSDEGNGRFLCAPPWSVPSTGPPDLSGVSFRCLQTSICLELSLGSWRHLPVGPPELPGDTR